MYVGDYRGRVVLINFWATWCPPCRAEFSVMQAAYEKPEDLVVLAVNFQESVEDVRAFVEEQEVTFPVLLDRTGQVALAYRSRALPTSFFVDAEGIITAVHLGRMTNSQIDSYVSQARGE